MGGRAEGLACTDLGARTPIGASGISLYFHGGCPNSHVVYNDTGGVADSILTDNCDDEANSDWLVPRGINNTDTEIIINFGCMKNIKGLKLKNIKKEKGGTKNFTVFLSNSKDGPWKPVLSEQFPELEDYGCAPMKTFDLE